MTSKLLNWSCWLLHELFLFARVCVQKVLLFLLANPHTLIGIMSKMCSRKLFQSSLFYSFLAVVPKSIGRKIEMIMKIVLIKMKLFFFM